MTAAASSQFDDRIDLGSIGGVTADSREVRPGWLYAAIPGTRLDGRAFIPEAVARGAAVVLTTSASGLEPFADRVQILVDPNPRRRLAQIAATFYGRQPRTIALVTGTNGKTSTVEFARQIWARLGHRAAGIGTLGVVVGAEAAGSGLTTPDPVSLYRILAGLAADGVEHVAMEASSHGLHQCRLDGVVSSIGAFTSFSRDHLDYHPTVEDYLAAKLRLFDSVLAPGGFAIVNEDDAAAPGVVSAARSHGHEVIGYGRAGSRLRLRNRTPEPDAQVLTIEADGRSHRVRMPIVAEFQAMNALAAAGIAIAAGGDTAAAIAALEALEGPRGRMQLVGRHPNGAAIYVDYSHTPAALETALAALRPHTLGNLYVVFGCGGDRDPGKRPEMGAIAAHMADRVTVTDDNPRSEDPGAIRRQILEGCPGAIEIGDRRAAIASAVRMLRPQDVLLIAGKGHEQGQIVGDKVIPFDDATVARDAVAAMEGSP